VKRSLRDDVRFATRRRGVTLVEMLVTLAILLLMMTVIVQIFQAATGALNAAQVYQELDNQLRLLDLTIRSDLGGVTCKLTPPNNPKNNTGYLEYGENEFADVQGEDSDDYIRFTAKAPAGQPFTGRMWVRAAYAAANSGTNTYQPPQPITITSEYAEIIYFLRNGNLYRRVLLVAPALQSTIEPSVNNVNPNPPFNGAGFFPIALGGDPVNLVGNQVSWQAVNDLSAHPATTGAPYQGNSVILNALGDLPNRENRFAYQRFSSDFQNLAGALVPGGDGLSDDLNGDNVPDYYPTLYPTVLAPTNNAGQLIYEPIPANRQALGAMAFPFVFPGAYSIPQTLTTAAYGWIHSPNPEVNIGSPSVPVGVTYQGNANGTTLNYLQNINHNPLDTGDNLSIPANQIGYLQTWWGFPTWRETLSPLWNDPSFPVNGAPAPYNLAAGQPSGLASRLNDANANPLADLAQFLPAMTSPPRIIPQLFNDGFGSSSVFLNNLTLWNLYSWEDDLVMTGVRSFDIKAYDNSLAAYADLGWGDDLRNYPLNISQNPNNQTNVPFLNGTPNTNLVGNPGFTGLTPYLLWNNQWVDLINQTFAHEGRMPPLVEDNRYDAQYGAVPANYYTAYPNYTGNIGDDNPAVVRLRRVWDSWSTEYTQAPGTGVNPNGFPAGPPYAPPIYPSYPPPYPAPLRGIQIQIRVTDPANQRVKTLTIRQDFTDKL